MKIIDCEQGSDAWHEARCGVITASRFSDVMTNPRAKKDKEAGKMSDSAESYMCELLAEKLTGNVRTVSAKALDWGNCEEPKAREEYAFDCEEEVRQIGFMLMDDGRIGASPDSLVGTDGGLEIKSPENPAIHLKTIFAQEVPKEHIAQIQGCLWISERKWWDFVSFRNDLPPGCNMYVQRVYRDEDFIRELSIRVTDFARELDRRYQLLTKESQ